MNDEAKQTIETISALVADGRLFDSTGYSVVQVTKDGEHMPLRLPIKSTGVADFQEKLAAKAPRPPVRYETHPKGSPVALELGSRVAVQVLVFDNTDEAYLEELETHNQKFTWQVAVSGLAVDWKRSDGSLVEEMEEKIAILKANGITGHQIQKIFADVQALTLLDEDRKDFLSAT